MWQFQILSELFRTFPGQAYDLYFLKTKKNNKKKIQNGV